MLCGPATISHKEKMGPRIKHVILWVYEESEKGEEKSKGWNDGMLDWGGGNEKNHETKKKIFGFFYPPRSLLGPSDRSSKP